MASLKIIGASIALCITLTVASREFKLTPEYKYYHGRHNPNYRNHMESINDENLSITRHDRKPHFPHSSGELQESYDKEEHKKPYQFNWHHPNIPQNLGHEKESQEEVARRRPFYPYFPYHPYYPHAYPSHNDNEFETIEALAKNYYGSHNPILPLTQSNSPESTEQLIYKEPIYHRPHNPHFPQYIEYSQESIEDKPKPLHHHNLHFGLFHKNPESNDDYAPNIIEHPYVIGEGLFQSPHETQPYHKPENYHNKPDPSHKVHIDSPHITSINEQKPFKIPSILSGLQGHHHGHGHSLEKPQNDEESFTDIPKPTEVPLIEENNEEESIEEDIIPLANSAELPLVEVDDKYTNKNEGVRIKRV